MGTRADFYVSRDNQLEWLGSIAWDGYPDGISKRLLKADTERKYRNALAAFFAGRDDVTLPERGWPWPWNTSDTTDYGYIFVPGVGVCYQHDERDYNPNDESYLVKAIGVVEPDASWVWDDYWGHERNARVAHPAFEWPDMSDRKNVRFDGGSGVIFVSARP